MPFEIETRILKERNSCRLAALLGPNEFGPGRIHGTSTPMTLSEDNCPLQDGNKNAGIEKRFSVWNERTIIASEVPVMIDLAPQRQIR
jgi:hypothetical protein